ncbi:hypothetical protein [Xanthomonas translucens]|uniref:hypothetical protein n=1 Tax=Xanthomonas campestris pv. translucens TaxID=343 RepID=UPI001F1F3251|nr:hypothetical protein [Xanthomonas translucens]UJB16804.1 hypothetical protein LTC53_09420 [Xanthomonas translucens pv. undulosa]
MPEPTAHNVPDARRVVEVVGFFQCHRAPLHAFNEALTTFKLSRPALLQLLQRVGVAELEAIGGTIPDASQRWERIVRNLGVSRAAAAQAPSEPSSPTLAAALERILEASSTVRSPSPVAQASTSSGRRKRALPDVAADTPPARPSWRRSAGSALASGLQDMLGSLLSWGQRRKRTHFADGLLDPGTPPLEFLRQCGDRNDPLRLQPPAPAAALVADEAFSPLRQEDFDWLMQFLG